MNGKDFIRMMRQDIDTDGDKERLAGVVAAMDAVIQMNPLAEISDAGKTPQDCYKKMYEYALGHKSGNYFCFAPEKAFEFISDYLGVKSKPQAGAAPAGIVDLEDFL
jgi:hypothetical protein